MSVRDSEPGDIYVDQDGILWRVTAVWRDPTVEVERVEHTSIICGTPQFPRQFGGVGGYMWHGFKRIYRPEKDAQSDKSEG